MALKKTSVATAVTISGTMIGMLISARLSDLPRKAPPRTMATAAAVAMVVLATAALSAMVSEFQAASLNLADSGPVKMSMYQRKLNPPQRVIESESLKL